MDASCAFYDALGFETVHGGPGTLGILNMQESRPAPWGGLMPVHGTSYIQIVGFDEAGPVADAILSYSQSTNPASPHAAPNVFNLIMKRRTLAGSMIGGIPQTQEMLDFCAAHGIVSDIELIRAEQVNEAYERMLKGDVKYRFVIDNGTLGD